MNLHETIKWWMVGSIQLSSGVILQKNSEEKNPA
jgi:hypothetical protein